MSHIVILSGFPAAPHKPFSFVWLNVAQYLEHPCSNRLLPSYLRQSTMAAASAARMALCGRFGLSETGLLASVDAGSPSVHRFCEEDLCWRRSSRLTWQRCARRRDRPRRHHCDRRRRCGWRRRRHNLKCKCHIKLTTNFCLAWVWSDLLFFLARHGMLHLGRRGYGDEGFPADVLEAFPRGIHMGPDTGFYSSVPQIILLFSLASLESFP